MRRFWVLILLLCAALSGCAAAATSQQAPDLSGVPPAPSATAVIIASTAPENNASALPPAENAGPKHTPDPASEMLVTGKVTAVLDRAIRVQDDGLGKELIITMLDRAEYADGVSREFAVGNRVTIITSNRLAKTLPERAAAIYILENS